MYRNNGFVMYQNAGFYYDCIKILRIIRHVSFNIIVYENASLTNVLFSKQIVILLLWLLSYGYVVR